MATKARCGIRWFITIIVTWNNSRTKQEKLRALSMRRACIRKASRHKQQSFVLQPLRQFYWRYVTLGGYRDRWHGLRLSLLMAWYEYRKYQHAGSLCGDGRSGTANGSPRRQYLLRHRDAVAAAFAPIEHVDLLALGVHEHIEIVIKQLKLLNRLIFVHRHHFHLLAAKDLGRRVGFISVSFAAYSGNFLSQIKLGNQSPDIGRALSGFSICACS